MTVVVQGADDIIEQIIHQTLKSSRRPSTCMWLPVGKALYRERRAY
jgi:hypothetical protein